MARRQVDEQPADPAVVHGRELGRDQLDIPVHRKERARVELAEGTHGKARDVMVRRRRSPPGAFVGVVRSSIDMRRLQRAWNFPKVCRFLDASNNEGLGTLS